MFIPETAQSSLALCCFTAAKALSALKAAAGRDRKSAGKAKSIPELLPSLRLTLQYSTSFLHYTTPGTRICSGRIPTLTCSIDLLNFLKEYIYLFLSGNQSSAAPWPCFPGSGGPLMPGSLADLSRSFEPTSIITAWSEFFPRNSLLSESRPVIFLSPGTTRH